MPLFMCSKCKCVENTALTDYAYRIGMLKEEPLCSECSPITNKWHDEFEKMDAKWWFVDQYRYLWKEKEHIPKHFKCIGVIGDDYKVS